MKTSNKSHVAQNKDESKFVDLPYAKNGYVVVRFPPEPSGYLHIGHVKAVLLNHYYKKKYNGKLIVRFDDTNPTKEKSHYEKVIMEDLEMLNISVDKLTYSSDYFNIMLELCEHLIVKGMAYVDDTDSEQIKKERIHCMESKNKNNSIEQNMKIWNEMKNGSEIGLKNCVRAKINSLALNGCLRDPVIYRCKNEPHPRTGFQYHVYPTYDFTCPILDSIEGVTHCLRSMEYHDRDEQYYWFINALNLRKPFIWEYSRLNMTHTVLSKRKLSWFVENGLVDDWNDPRLPTLRGILRRGMTVDGLKQFITAQGSSQSVVTMEWDKIWAFNKKVIDPTAPRYMSLTTDNIPVFVQDVVPTFLNVPRHPKNPTIGIKTVSVGHHLLIEREDAEKLEESKTATFITWGNFIIKKINRKDNKITSIEVQPDLENNNFKNTVKVVWLSADSPVPCICVYFDHILHKDNLKKGEDFREFTNTNTRKEVKMIGEQELLKVKKSEIIQLQKHGFFICDKEYSTPSTYSGCISPIVLFAIPDGKRKRKITENPPGIIHSNTQSNVIMDPKVVLRKNSSVSNNSRTIQYLEELGNFYESNKTKINSYTNLTVPEQSTFFKQKCDYEETVSGEAEYKSKFPPATAERNFKSLSESSISMNKNHLTETSRLHILKFETNDCEKHIPQSGSNVRDKKMGSIRGEKNTHNFHCNKKRETRLGIEASKTKNFSEWYSQVLTKSELLEYYNISGCYIYRPGSYSVWEYIKEFLDSEIKKLGVQNCYFPLFISRNELEKEKQHIADFAPEVAWVTQSGDHNMAEPIAIRPTSETAMYPTYAKWIQSYRDLPLKLNQWNNVVRWEFKNPMPFLRTREFLWQEGHTAYASLLEAEEEITTILDLYAQVYTNLLAVPVIKGYKTVKEKFAGADYTATIEAFISTTGRAIQGATSHHLGQNFSKMFDISYEDPKTKEKKLVYQNSWGITTRTIGVMIMIHSDNQGLVLPPRVANIQVVIIPCGAVTTKPEVKTEVEIKCRSLECELTDAKIRVFGDYRDNYTAGWRNNYWTLKGIPLRVEMGPREIKKNCLTVSRRDTNEKIKLPRDKAKEMLLDLLESIQENLYHQAQQNLKFHCILVHKWDEFCKKLREKYMILSPFCGAKECEEEIRKDSGEDETEACGPSMGAKSLCIPFEQPTQICSTVSCINPKCQSSPQHYAYFGFSY